MECSCDSNQHRLDEAAEAEADTMSSSSEVSSIGSVESDLSEEVENNNYKQLSITEPLHDMSSLHQLPSKRGLSKHYQGKSQSFASLSEVRCLEDLVKPENPYNKKLRSCKSYASAIADSIYKQPSSAKAINSKRASSSSSSNQTRRGSCSRRNSIGSFLGSSRPPIHPHRSASSSSFSNQTVLFA